MTDVATDHSTNGVDRSALLPPKPVDLATVERGIALVLDGLGQSDKEEIMRNTPRRVAELYAESINPASDIEPDFKVFENPGMHDMIAVTDVHYVSMCEHHLAPAFGVAHVAYIPGERVAGYSKLKKALNYLARQPQLNERLVVHANDFLQERLQPLGLALVLRSVHCCIALRTNAPMQEVVTVSDFRGTMQEPVNRQTFWQMALQSKPLFLGA
jgi:GTP cyclohydrolase IA